MQWRNFEQGDLPQNEVFLLCLGENVFFAKTKGSKIITKSCYADAVAIKENGIVARGGDIGVFLNNLAKQDIKPLLCHFHKPEAI